MKIEEFIGVWKCQFGNIIIIKPNDKTSLLVDFISGKNGQPIIRPYFSGKESIDMKAELDYYETSLKVELWEKGKGFQLSLLRDQVYFNKSDNQFYLTPGITRLENDTFTSQFANLFGPLEYYHKQL
jgi:hypothetical protein